MAFKEILYDIKGQVAIITLNNRHWCYACLCFPRERLLDRLFEVQPIKKGTVCLFPSAPLL